MSTSQLLLSNYTADTINILIFNGTNKIYHPNYTCVTPDQYSNSQYAIQIFLDSLDYTLLIWTKLSKKIAYVPSILDSMDGISNWVIIYVYIDIPVLCDGTAVGTYSSPLNAFSILNVLLKDRKQVSLPSNVTINENGTVTVGDNTYGKSLHQILQILQCSAFQQY